MRILVDTNILLDYILDREPYGEAARCVVKACKDGTIKGCIAAHSISNMFFILRKVYAPEERRILLKSLCTLFEQIILFLEIQKIFRIQRYHALIQKSL